MILFLDTSAQEISICLLSEDYKIIKTVSVQTKTDLADKLLLEVKKLLGESGVDKKDLNEIIVVKGSGSYTGLRIGLSTANLLAYSLNISISGIELTSETSKEELLDQLKNKKASTRGDKNFSSAVIPFYKFPPHITVKKRLL